MQSLLLPRGCVLQGESSHSRSCEEEPQGDQHQDLNTSKVLYTFYTTEKANTGLPGLLLCLFNMTWNSGGQHKRLREQGKSKSSPITNNKEKTHTSQGFTFSFNLQNVRGTEVKPWKHN